MRPKQLLLCAIASCEHDCAEGSLCVPGSCMVSTPRFNSTDSFHVHPGACPAWGRATCLAARPLYLVLVSIARASPDASQPPPPTPKLDQGRRWYRHRRPQPSSPRPPLVHGQSSTCPMLRAPVHTRLGLAMHHEVDSVQLVDSTLLSPSAPTADMTRLLVPQEAAVVNQEAVEIMHGKPICDHCNTWPEGEIFRSSVRPTAVEECPPHVSCEEGEAATGCLGRHVFKEAQLVHKPSSSPGPPSAGPDDAPSVGLSPEKNETVLLDSSQLCSSPLVVSSSSAAPMCQSS
jgi:hypothetical protein